MEKAKNGLVCWQCITLGLKNKECTPLAAFYRELLSQGGDPSAKQKDLDTYIDLSLKNWGWKSQQEFYQWGRQKKAGIKKLKEGGQTQLTKYYEPWIRRETLSHHEAIKRLTKEWQVSSPTAVKKLGWDPRKKFYCQREPRRQRDDTKIIYHMCENRVGC